MSNSKQLGTRYQFSSERPPHKIPPFIQCRHEFETKKMGQDKDPTAESEPTRTPISSKSMADKMKDMIIRMEGSLPQPESPRQSQILHRKFASDSSKKTAKSTSSSRGSTKRKVCPGRPILPVKRTVLLKNSPEKLNDTQSVGSLANTHEQCSPDMFEKDIANFDTEKSSQDENTTQFSCPVERITTKPKGPPPISAENGQHPQYSALGNLMTFQINGRTVKKAWIAYMPNRLNLNAFNALPNDKQDQLRNIDVGKYYENFEDFSEINDKLRSLYNMDDRKWSCATCAHIGIPIERHKTDPFHNFFSKGCLKTHFNRNHCQLFPCSICKQDFKTARSLHIHNLDMKKYPNLLHQEHKI